jgi:hypothetical protein
MDLLEGGLDVLDADRLGLVQGGVGEGVMGQGD